MTSMVFLFDHKTQAELDDGDVAFRLAAPPCRAHRAYLPLSYGGNHHLSSLPLPRAANNVTPVNNILALTPALIARRYHNLFTSQLLPFLYRSPPLHR